MKKVSSEVKFNLVALFVVVLLGLTHAIEYKPHVVSHPDFDIIGGIIVVK